MSRYKRMTDLYFTEDGDLFLDENAGDFEDTRLHQYRGFIQRVVTRVMSTKGEWNLQRNVGANLNDFLGKRNSAQIGAAIRSRILTELLSEGLVRSTDLNVIVFPTNSNTVAVIVEVTPPDVASRITLTFTYDMRENRVVPRNI